MINTKEFYRYLKKKGYSDSTIRVHVQTLNSFVQWCQAMEHTDPTRLRYVDLLEYVRMEREKKITDNTLFNNLNTIKHWYESLKEVGEIEANPARRIKLRNPKQTVIKNQLEWAEMEQIYEAYATRKLYRERQLKYSSLRNTVILGLMIEQAVQVCELHLLQTGHVDLKKGTLTVPASNKGAERQLRLAPYQMLVLHEYLTTGREEMLKRCTLHEREAARQKESLIPGNMQYIILQLFKTLKKIDPRVTDSYQFRNSIIMQWLKMYGLRQAQYMAGHKQVASTEKFARQNTEDLKDKLVKYHPFG